jgi:hypothetical protein
MRAVSIICASFAAMVLQTLPAYAYLDPGTGSMLAQGLIAAFAGGAAFMGLYWRKFLALFSAKSNPTDKVE